MAYYKTYDDSREHFNYISYNNYAVLTNEETVVVGNTTELFGHFQHESWFCSTVFGLDNCQIKLEFIFAW